ncbi:helix-turn-helix transcriptional regulator [uncultured Algimonas sp.]|uniref:helix-turn-helix transcriptional regulator n=1 Tax=uncultured Algimonas sp. TaxID=1547920 RepID=UPI00262A4470|nr:helix-turn-helix transcriptional regulator [uncultured Algimonas sp.]
MDPQGTLSTFLKTRRDRLDPSAFGFSGRRRTPGLRREEVAQRANISTTWYTWLEQGRGGPPSPRVLDSLSKALMLTEAEREHLYLVGIGRLPKPQTNPTSGITPRLQRFLDALSLMPAFIATSQWDIIAWNDAARAALTNYPALEEDDRNILRRMFLDPDTRAAQRDWDGVARYLVATFRAAIARAGEDGRAAELISELLEKSPEFSTMWAESDVQSTGDGVKRMQHPKVGAISFEFSSFAVDGRPDLRLITYTPAGTDDLRKMKALIETLK